MSTKHIRANLGLIVLFILFAVAFVWLNLQNPAQRPVLVKAKFSELQAILLLLAVIVPYICIWFVGLIGYARLRAYVVLVRKTKEGKALSMVAGGIVAILLSLPISSLFSSVAQLYQVNDPGQALQIRRIGAYVGIVLLLWAFYWLMAGSRMMLNSLGRPSRYLPRMAILLFMLLGGLYIYFVLTNPLFDGGVATNGHLPAWAVIDTVVLPRLLAWYWGLYAAWNLYEYASAVPGQIYRLAFSYLAIGIGVVNLSIVLLQYVQAVSAVASWPLGVILLVVYIVLVVISAGFMLLARGGKELAKIEAA